MKKSLILVGMLAVGYVNAQQGNVGINTETPKATLEILPSKTNLEGTTNEGIIIPKLTKARVLAIATDKLVEGTKVYITDEILASDNTKFQGTGKGFYFYNGTKWVKQLDSDNGTDTEIWTNDTEKSAIRIARTTTNASRRDTRNVFITDGGRLGVGIAEPKDRIEAYGNILATGGLKSHYNGVIGGFVELKNESKTGNFEVQRYRIYNMTSIGESNYVPGLHFWAYGHFDDTKVDENGVVEDGNTWNYSSRMVLTDAGNLGIGFRSRTGTSTQTDKKLEVNGDARIVGLAGVGNRIVYADEKGVLVSGVEASSLGLWEKSVENKAIKLSVNSTGAIRNDEQGFYITDNGRLGIRTNNPTQALDIVGNARLTSTGATRLIINAAGDNYGHLRIQKNGNSRWDFGVDNSSESKVDEGSNFYISSANNEGRFSTRLSILRKTGNVGIGIDAPTEKLNVSGNILADGGLISSIDDNIGGYIELINLKKDKDKEVKRWRIYNMTDKTGGQNYVPGLHFWSYAADGTNLSSQMVITDAGNVGIGFPSRTGTSTQTTEKLEVNGNVKANAFLGANGATVFPDYVFQKYYTGTSSIKSDYSFKTLSQVEDFVKTNGHLPGYKSAETIKAQGYVDLMETQLTNVEKIEELYLHSIEQDKAIKAKDAEIQDLKQRLERLEKLIR